MSSFLTNYEHKRTLPNDSSTSKFSLNQMDISQHPNYSNYQRQRSNPSFTIATCSQSRLSAGKIAFTQQYIKQPNYLSDRISFDFGKPSNLEKENYNSNQVSTIKQNTYPTSRLETRIQRCKKILNKSHKQESIVIMVNKINNYILTCFNQLKCVQLLNEIKISKTLQTQSEEQVNLLQSSIILEKKVFYQTETEPIQTSQILTDFLDSNINSNHPLQVLNQKLDQIENNINIQNSLYFRKQIDCSKQSTMNGFKVSFATSSFNKIKNDKLDMNNSQISIKKDESTKVQNSLQTQQTLEQENSIGGRISQIKNLIGSFYDSSLESCDNKQKISQVSINSKEKQQFLNIESIKSEREGLVNKSLNSFNNSNFQYSSLKKSISNVDPKLNENDVKVFELSEFQKEHKVEDCFSVSKVEKSKQDEYKENPLQDFQPDDQSDASSYFLQSSTNTHIKVRLQSTFIQLFMVASNHRKRILGQVLKDLHVYGLKKCLFKMNRKFSQIRVEQLKRAVQFRIESDLNSMKKSLKKFQDWSKYHKKCLHLGTLLVKNKQRSQRIVYSELKAFIQKKIAVEIFTKIILINVQDFFYSLKINYKNIEQRDRIINKFVNLVIYQKQNVYRRFYQLHQDFKQKKDYFEGLQLKIQENHKKHLKQSFAELRINSMMKKNKLAFINIGISQLQRIFLQKLDSSLQILQQKEEIFFTGQSQTVQSKSQHSQSRLKAKILILNLIRLREKTIQRAFFKIINQEKQDEISIPAFQQSILIEKSSCSTMFEQYKKMYTK